MIVLICLTVLVISIPALHLINQKYVQKIALFIGCTLSTDFTEDTGVRE